MNTKYVVATLAMLATLMLLSGEVQATGIKEAGDQFSLNINISGTVISSGSCTFDQQGTSEVDFGDVKYSKTPTGTTLQGSYLKDLTSGMTCTGDTEGGAVMTLSSKDQKSVAYNGHKLLTTSVNGAASTDLAIQLLVNGVAQDINSAFTVDMQNPPKLAGELIQVGDGSGLINDADISASATLTMAFN